MEKIKFNKYGQYKAMSNSELREMLQSPMIYDKSQRCMARRALKERTKEEKHTKACTCVNCMMLHNPELR